MTARKPSISVFKTVATSVFVALCFLVLAPIFQVPGPVSPSFPSFAAETSNKGDETCGPGRSALSFLPELKKHDCTGTGMLILPGKPSVQCQIDWLYLCQTVVIDAPEKHHFDDLRISRAPDQVVSETDRPPPRHGLI